MNNLKLDQQGKQFLQHEEGCVLHAYQDRAGIWTIAYGNSYYIGGTKVKQGDTITQQQADQLFDLLSPSYESTVNTINNLNQQQFNPCVSLCWNIGSEGFITSTLYKHLCTNPNDQTRINTTDMTDINVRQEIATKGLTSIHLITYYFLLWHNDGGSFDIDLFNRRWRESLMYWGQS